MTERHIEIERSIVKKFRKPIWNKFIGGIKEYNLIEENDCIAVCISGGKDSMLMAKCLERLQGYSEIPFTLKYIVLDAGYNEKNRQLIKENCKTLNIPVQTFNVNIFNYVKSQGGSPCYLCARMRRGNLYKFAQNLGCNKIALGHHLDDVIETTVMSMLYSAEIKTMMPKLHSTNFEGMQLIRPLYMVREKDIIAWQKYNNLEFIGCACPLSEDYESKNHEKTSKRKEVKELIAKLEADNDKVPMNIFMSVHNVNLGTIVGYRRGDKAQVHTFLEDY